MRVLCCYTGLRPQTAAALARFAPATEYADVSASVFRYWEEITARWNGHADLAIVEHDIVIHYGVMQSFESCPSPWCVYPYMVLGAELDFGLGCTRFRKELMAAVSPAAIQEVPGCCIRCTPPGGGTAEAAPGCWAHLDCKISWTLDPVLGAERGWDAPVPGPRYERCIHRPAVRHLNPTAEA